MADKRTMRTPWERNLWSIVTAQLLVILAFQAGFILIPYYIQEMGITEPREVTAWTGAYQSIGAISFAIFTPIWGALSDRYGRKLMLVRAMGATMVVLVVMGLVRTPTQLLVLRVVQGIFTGTPSAASALVAAGSPKNRLAYGLGLIQTALFVGSSLGPMIGGYVADAISYRATFFGSSVLAGAAFAIVLFLVREPEESAAISAQAKTQSPIAAFASLVALPSVLVLVALTFCTNLTMGLLGPVLPIVVQDLVADRTRLASTAGAISGGFALTAAVAALVVGRYSDRLGYRRVVTGCSAGMALLYVPQAFARTALSLGLTRAVQGFFQGGMTPSISAMVVDSAPPDKTGAALGLSTSASSLGVAVGPMAGAFLMGYMPASGVFLASAAIFVGIALAAGIAGRRGRRAPHLAPEAKRISG